MYPSVLGAHPPRRGLGKYPCSKVAAPLRALTGVSDLGKCAATAVNLETAAELAVAGFERLRRTENSYVIDWSTKPL